MPTDSEGHRRIVYCVGEERSLRDVLPESEAAALLAAASRAGLRGVRVVDPDGKALWGSGNDVPPPGEGDPRRPILLEGEAAGSVVLPAGATGERRRTPFSPCSRIPSRRWRTTT